MAVSTRDEGGSGVSDDFKKAFRHHPAGVALLVTVHDGVPHGLAASSLASVSADPPMLSFSVTRTGSSARALVAAEEVSVVLLGEHQARLAVDFATRGAPRFTSEQGWRRSGSLLELDGAPLTLHTRTTCVVPAGGSWLVLAEVTRIHHGEAAAPLVYHDRAYRTLGPPPVAEHDLHRT